MGGWQGPSAYAFFLALEGNIKAPRYDEVGERDKDLKTRMHSISSYMSQQAELTKRMGQQQCAQDLMQSRSCRAYQGREGDELVERIGL
eukprot:COSAG02_NODE_5282_length_4473_cov_3.860768_1_plen_88_part_10